MKRKSIIISIVLITLCLSRLCASTAHFKVTAVDDENNPIEKVETTYFFRTYHAKPFGEGWGDDVREKNQTFYSNKIGFSEAIGELNIPENFWIRLKKDGYYNGFCGFSNKKAILNKVLNRWEPYPCEIKIVLKKIKNPVPMYVKCTDWLRIEMNVESIGYDLEIGDWVHPYGEGKIKDFIFKTKSSHENSNKNNFSLNITFSNEKDGIIGYENPNDNSEFKYPYEASFENFQVSLIKHKNYYPHLGGFRIEKNINNDNRYIFRVRTKTDEQGNIISANYGYINSDFDGYAHYKKDKNIPIELYSRIKFTYFFNPNEKSRSLEFNGENLFWDRNAYGFVDDHKRQKKLIEQMKLENEKERNNK